MKTHATPIPSPGADGHGRATAASMALGQRTPPRRVTDELVPQLASLRDAGVEEKDERSGWERFVDFFRGQHEPEARAPIEGRFSVAVPEMSTVFAIGAADASSIGGWKGTFRGVTLGTVEDLWMGARAVRVIAGVADEGEVGALDLERAALAGEETLAWVESAIAAHMLLDTGLNARPSVSTLLRMTQVGMNVIRTSFATDAARREHDAMKEATAPATDAADEAARAEQREARLEERAQEKGQLHLHGEREVLLSSPGAIASSASTSNLVYGGMLAEVVGGLGAGVKGGFGAEVSAIGRAAVSGYLAAAVEAVGNVEIASRKGGVEIEGANISIGSSPRGLLPLVDGAGSAMLGQAATQTIAVEAETSVRLVAGQHGPRLSLDAGAGLGILHARDSFVAVDEETVHVHAAKGFHLSTGGPGFVDDEIKWPDYADLLAQVESRAAARAAFLDLIAVGVGAGVAAGADALDQYLKGEGDTPSSVLADVVAGALAGLTAKGLVQVASRQASIESANRVYFLLRQDGVEQNAKAVKHDLERQFSARSAVFSVDESRIVLQVGRTRLELDPEEATLQAGGASITLREGGIRLRSGSTEVELTDRGVEVTTRGRIDLAAGRSIRLRTDGGEASLKGNTWMGPV